MKNKHYYYYYRHLLLHDVTFTLFISTHKPNKTYRAYIPPTSLLLPSWLSKKKGSRRTENRENSLKWTSKWNGRDEKGRKREE